MWWVGFVHLSQARASLVSISMGINHMLIISPLPNARRRACISMASTSKSDNAVITVSQPQLSSLSCSSAVSLPPYINAVKNSPELALLSLFFVHSAAMGAIFSFAIISIPTTIKLGDSADRLSKIVSEEMPGTLSSLKLSGLELNDLTQQLTNLRYAKKSRSNKPSSSTSRNFLVAE